jgi:hypothetical protein
MASHVLKAMIRTELDAPKRTIDVKSLELVFVGSGREEGGGRATGVFGVNQVQQGGVMILDLDDFDASSH